MKKLPRWAISDTMPAFLDIESMSAIEMVGRLYDAMRTFIDEYNSFVDNAETIIDDYVNGANEDFEIFATGLRQEFNDFISVVTMKGTGQNNKLDAIVDHIKTNAEGYINEVITALKNSGELDNAILSALDNIDTTVNEFIDNIDNVIDEFTASFKEDYDAFKETVEASVLEMSAHIDDVDSKTSENDGKFARVIQGMRAKLVAVAGRLRTIDKLMTANEGYDWCTVTRVRDEYLVISTSAPTTKPTCRMIAERDIMGAFEIQRFQEYGIDRGSIYTERNAEKTLVSIIIDDHIYEEGGTTDPLDAIRVEGLKFKSLDINYKTHMSDGADLLTTIHVDTSGVTIMQTKPSSSNVSLVTGLITGSYVQSLNKHGTAQVFRMKTGSNTTHVFHEYNYSTSNCTIKKVAF